jgi:meiotic recombination protein SPO11
MDVVVEFIDRGSTENSQIDPVLQVRVLYDTPNKRGLSFVKQPREFAIFFRVLSIILNALKTHEFLTKRSIYYQDVTLFQNQGVVDRAIENIACCLEVPRTSLGIIACPRGFIAGPIQWIDTSNNVTDCSTTVQIIPTIIDRIKVQKSCAIAVLVVEKESVFMRLVQSTIVREAILVTGRGIPDYSTRVFVKFLEDTTSVPVVGLFDPDPYGFLILHVYKFGSRMASYDGMNMACSGLQWLGIRPSEMGIIKKRNLQELTERDRSLLDRILDEPHLPDEYRQELEIMKQRNVKAELEALMTDTQELTDLYLPEKFARHDWI